MKSVSVPLTLVRKRDNGTTTIYQKHEELGRGGFAVVYRVSNLNTGEEFALKAIPKERVSKPKTLSKLKSEISIQKILNHPNLLRSYDSFEDALNYYIIVELCPTKSSIKEFVKSKGHLSEEETAYILKEVISGIRYLHDLRIIHRDLKLENFLIGFDGKIKIADFGLSTKLYYDDERKHTVCGTPNYLSPELVTASANGHSYEVDIWAIGVSAFIMLTGHPPFESNKKTITYEYIKNCQYHFPADIRITSFGKDFIKNILQIDPERRPNASDLSLHPFIQIMTKQQRSMRNYINSLIATNVTEKENKSVFINNPVNYDFNNNNNNNIINKNLNLNNHDNILINENVDFDNRLNDKLRTPFSKITAPLQVQRPITQQQSTPVLQLLQPINQFTNNANINIVPQYNFPLKQAEPEETLVPKCFVARFCDHSDKAGLGYLLLDGTTGVCFNDETRIVMDPFEKFLQYYGSFNTAIPEVYDVKTNEIEPKKVAYLRLYASSLKKTKSMFELPNKAYNKNTPLKHIKNWTRTNEATLFKFDNRNIQVNFEDHQKLFIFTNEKKFFLVRSIKEKIKLISFFDVKKEGPAKEEIRRFSIAKGMLAALNGI